MALCETKRQVTTRLKKDEIPGYEIVERNQKQGKEGIMLAVKMGSFKALEEVTQSELRSILTVRITYKNDTLRVVTLHAPQESDPAEERTDFFEEVAIQVERAVTAGDKLLVLGDFNARVSLVDDDKVQPLSPNGTLLHDLIEGHQLSIANYSPNTVGKWTRIQKTKHGVNKSAIDYVLFHEEDLPLMQEMIIDEDKIFCPYRERRTKSGKNIIFSDHCAILVKLQVRPGGHESHTSTRKVWNLSENGYAVYKEKSKQEMKFEQDPNSTTAYNNWRQKFEQLLHSCFSKKTIKTGNAAKPRKTNRGVRNILSNLAKKGKVQRSVAKLYLQRVIEIETRQQAKHQARRLQHTISSLTQEDKFSPNGY